MENLPYRLEMLGHIKINFKPAMLSRGADTANVIVQKQSPVSHLRQFN
jgi:hypothetical protein